MKKRIIAFLLVCMLVFASGCTANREPATEQDMIRTAANFAQCFITNDYQAAYDNLTSSLRYSYSVDTLSYAWSNSLKNAGEFVADLGATQTRWDDAETFVVFYDLDYSNIGIQVMVIFNEYGEMTNVSIDNHDYHMDTAAPAGVIEQEISFVNSAGITIHGVIALPESGDAVAGAVLIPSTGAVDYNSVYGRTAMFRDIAHALARQGIASIRINKRSYETTNITMLTYTYASEFIEDFSAAYDMLCAQERVDANRVFILGHSGGSLAAPRIDQEKNSAGLIILSGTNRDLWQLHYDQNIEYLNSNPNLDAVNALAAEKSKAEKLYKQSALEAQQDTIFNYNGCYYWEQVHNKADLSLITKPVLLIRSTDDFLTYQSDWKSLLEGYANAQLTTKEYAGLNHMLTDSIAAKTTDDFYVQSYVDERVIADIAAFIQSH